MGHVRIFALAILASLIAGGVLARVSTVAMTVFWLALGITASRLWQYGQPRHLQ